MENEPKDHKGLIGSRETLVGGIALFTIGVTLMNSGTEFAQFGAILVIAGVVALLLTMIIYLKEKGELDDWLS